jgi:hypothetical protein
MRRPARTVHLGLTVRRSLAPAARRTLTLRRLPRDPELADLGPVGRRPICRAADHGGRRPAAVAAVRRAQPARALVVTIAARRLGRARRPVSLVRPGRRARLSRPASASVGEPVTLLTRTGRGGMSRRRGMRTCRRRTVHRIRIHARSRSATRMTSTGWPRIRLQPGRRSRRRSRRFRPYTEVRCPVFRCPVLCRRVPDRLAPRRPGAAPPRGRSPHGPTCRPLRPGPAAGGRRRGCWT